jgi:hypothetical protein
MTPERFDAIILGTGQAGKPLALDLAHIIHQSNESKVSVCV